MSAPLAKKMSSLPSLLKSKMATPPAMVSGAWRSGVSELSSLKSIG